VNDIIHGDSAQILQTLETDSVDLVVTSPPYDNLRTYNDMDNWDFETIAQQLARVVKDGGVVVWIVGDAMIDGSETGSSFKQALYFKDHGFKLHDTMIYQKVNFSNPSITRYHQIFEYMFVFSKGKPKTFNGIKDRANKYAGQTVWGRNTHRLPDGTLREQEKNVISDYGLRYNVWSVKTVGQTKENPTSHPAVFPVQLAMDHITTWSNPGDLVLDPFAGSGTVGVACKNLNRNYLLIERDETYYNEARERLGLDKRKLPL